QYRSEKEPQKRFSNLSEEKLKALDRRIDEMLSDARQKAATLLKENQALVETLRDMLLEHKVIEAKTLKEITGVKPEASKTEEHVKEAAKEQQRKKAAPKG